MLLAKSLVETMPGYEAVVVTEGWPEDESVFADADAVVIYCDGGGRHPASPHLASADRLFRKGVGLACLHYGVETVKGDPGDAFLRWIGGYFETHWSVNPHWDGNFKTFPDHPVSSGVEPFMINDEWYYHMRFQPNMANVTPILSDLPGPETLKRKDGPHQGNPAVRAAVLERKEPQHVGWAYQRGADYKHGRGFGFTGGHFHRNWTDDNFRKVVLNAIVWIAKGQVPHDGVTSKTPTDAEMDANQDKHGPLSGRIFHFPRDIKSLY
jgi:type 1 glutamine amidotransferase